MYLLRLAIPSLTPLESTVDYRRAGRSLEQPAEPFKVALVACCRRIWPLLSDPRSRAVVEAPEAYLAGEMTAEAAGRVFAEWGLWRRNAP